MTKRTSDTNQSESANESEKPEFLDDNRNAIAIVGMACWYPGAKNPQEMWESVLARRREFRRMPDKRTPLSDYYDADASIQDKFYQTRVGVLDGFVFDWAKYRIPQGTYASTDIAQWLALEVAHSALKDAGYSRESIPKNNTGVFVGNTDTGEQMRSNYMRLRWPFVRKTIVATAVEQGLDPSLTEDLVASTEQAYKAFFPEVTEDFGAGSIAATIAGRIANYFDFHGGGYVIDGACASSMVAVCDACNLLFQGDLDLALAGGVDISLDPLELVAFSKAGALSKTDITPYDRRADGFVAAEGSGFVVLKRLEDARKAGDQIYAVIRGWGMSSDGKGGIMQPTPAGQAMAIQRAWTRAGFDPREMAFIEGHGTGTQAGDRAELEGLTAVMKKSEIMPRACGIGTIKSLFGHTKAAAGIASLIKASIAVNRRVIPPTAACEQPSGLFETVAKNLYPIQLGEVRGSQETLRAGVSAFGFGGINVHVAIESGGAPSPKLATSIKEKVLMVSHQDTEVFVLGAYSVPELSAQAVALMGEVKNLSYGELVDLSAQLARAVPPQAPVRVALVASSPIQLLARLEALCSRLEEQPPIEGGFWTDPWQETWIGVKTSHRRAGFLLPGQGSQHLMMARTLVQRHRWAADMLEQADRWAIEAGGERLSEFMFRATDRAVESSNLEQWEKELARTEIAQPATCLVSVIFAKYLEILGIRPSIVGGHSLGELTAFHLAGAYDFETLIKLAVARGKAMTGSDERPGAMANLSCSLQQVKDLIQGIAGCVVVANINSPQQIVISGDERSVIEVLKIAGQKGIQGRRLAVSNAFHSPLVEGAAASMRGASSVPENIGKFTIPLGSSMVREQHDPGVEPGINLRAHFSSQITSPVNFIDLVHHLTKQCDFLIEVGPGKALSALARDILGVQNVPCLSVDGKSESARDLNVVLAATYALGTDVNWSLLYSERLVRPYVPPSKKVFIESPLERTQTVSTPASFGIQQTEFVRLLTNASGATPLEVAAYLEQRLPFITQVALADMKHGSKGTRASEGGTAIAPVVVSNTSKAATLGEPVVEKQNSIEEFLLDWVAKRTGYQRDSISSDAKLLADLNIDSIKAGELVSAVARKFDVSGKLDASEFSNASLREIANAVRNVASSTEKQDSKPVSMPIPKQERSLERPTIESFIIDIVTKRTGFPKDSVRENSKLLDDLNIDSIKAGEIVSATATEFGAQGKVDASRFSNASIAEIAVAVFEVAAHGAPANGSKQVKIDPELLLVEQLSLETGFAVGSIKPETHIDDDLGLGKEKFKRVMDRVAAQLRVEGAVDLEPLRKRTVSQVAAVFRSLLATSSAEVGAALERVSPSDHNATWTRNFGIEVIKDPLAERNEAWYRRTEDKWETACVLILAEEQERDFADSLQTRLAQKGARVEMATFSAARRNGLVKESRFSHIVGVLPASARNEKTARETYENSFGRLLTLATVSAASQAPRRRTTVALVQFGGGLFGTGSVEVSPHVCGAAAFARSLHLERPDLRVRVIDFSNVCDASKSAEMLIRETETSESFCAAGYDEEFERRTPQVVLHNRESYQKRDYELKVGDVVLMTGGGKGVTAECAIGLARATGATMVLLGTSAYPAVGSTSSSELTRTFDRFQAEGLKFKYYSCDVTDAAAVATVIAQVRETVGRITAVFHAAVTLTGAKAEMWSPKAAITEMSPKVLGAVNLCAALESDPPKLFVGFTSVSFITGYPGSTAYTYSSEMLDLILRRFSQRHPETATHCFAWGLWGGTGWATKRDNAVKVQNVGRSGLVYSALATQDAVARFVELCSKNPGTHHVLVTGSIHGFDTWNQVRKAATIEKKLPYIEEVVSHEPMVQLVARTRLRIDRDAYLRDHMYRGMYVFPTVFGLEAIAEAAIALVNDGLEVTQIENLEMPRPMVIDPDAGLMIEIRAEILEGSGSGSRVQVAISSEQSAFSEVCVSAVVVLGTRAIAEKKPPRTGTATFPVNPKVDLYGRHFFVGPLFQRMGGIMLVGVDDTQCFILPTLPSVGGHQGMLGDFDSFVLGDPYARDTMIHASYLCDLQAFSFTARIGKIEFFRTTGGAIAFSCNARRVFRRGRDVQVELASLNETGEVFERISEYALKVVEEHPELPIFEEISDPQRLVSRDERVLESLIVDTCKTFGLEVPVMVVGLEPDLKRQSKEVKQLREIELAKRAFGRCPNDWHLSNPELKWLPSGRPCVVTESASSQIDISFSLDETYLVASIGKHSQGCKLTTLLERSRGEWVELVGNPHEGLISELMTGGDSLVLAGARLWSAIEAGRKAYGDDMGVLSIQKREKGAISFLASSNGKRKAIVTFPVSLARGPNRVLAIASESSVKSEESPLKKKASDQGNFFKNTYQVTWRDCGTAGKNLSPLRYVEWFKDLIDLMLGQDIGKQFAREVLAGTLGGVSRWTELCVEGHAEVYDLVEARLWVTELTPTSVQFQAEFWRVDESKDNDVLVARITGEGIPVARDVDGQLVPTAFPERFQKAYEAYLRKDGNLGPVRWVDDAPRKPGVGEAHFTHSVQTSTIDSDLVGNINNVNYFVWQAHARDLFLRECGGASVLPLVTCEMMKVDYLRSCMPFDRIDVDLSYRVVAPGVAMLESSFYRVGEAGTRKKVAAGIQQLTWSQGNEKGKALSLALSNATSKLYKKEGSNVLLEKTAQLLNPVQE